MDFSTIYDKYNEDKAQDALNLITNKVSNGDLNTLAINVRNGKRTHQVSVNRDRDINNDFDFDPESGVYRAKKANKFGATDSFAESMERIYFRFNEATLSQALKWFMPRLSVLYKGGIQNNTDVLKIVNDMMENTCSSENGIDGKKETDAAVYLLNGIICNASEDTFGGNPGQVKQWLIDNKRFLGQQIAAAADTGKLVSDISNEKQAQGLIGQDSFAQIAKEIKAKA